jgi:cytochrome c-type biogenesis protein CcmH/NrfG
MKKYSLTIIVLMLFSLMTYASNEAYEKAMLKELQNMKSAASPEDLQKVANGFARIAQMMPEEWLPDYYAALALANAGFRSEGGADVKDPFFEQAKKHVEKAAKISPNNSEVVALQGFITMGELAVDPASRGQHLSGLAMQTFGKAVDLNRQNPRAIMMLGQMELGMAQFFGQGPEKACGLVDASLALFAKEAAEAKEGNFNPTWGKGMAEEMKKNTCK